MRRIRDVLAAHIARRVAVGAVAVPMIALIGCSAAGRRGAESPSRPPIPLLSITALPTPHSAGASVRSRRPTHRHGPPTLRAFTNSCQNRVQNVALAHAVYSPRVSAKLGKAQTYEAAIVLRGTRIRPTQVIAGPSPTAARVKVECEVGAELTPVGSGVDVSDPGWHNEQFTPAISGELKWIWTITPRHIGNQQLRLELRPAVIAGSAGAPVDSATVDFPITVHVSTSLVSRGWSLLMSLLTFLVAPLGAIAAVLAASAKIRKSLKELIRSPSRKRNARRKQREPTRTSPVG